MTLGGGGGGGEWPHFVMEITILHFFTYFGWGGEAAQNSPVS